jgi:predicted aspartyl protease
MGVEMMGRVVVSAVIQNWDDVKQARAGERGADAVRSIRVDQALVDTGATYLGLPRRFIDLLGLQMTRERLARTTAGTVKGRIYEPVQLTVAGRDCWPEVAEVDDACPVLIGQIPLESLDLLVDPVGQRLIGNPAHGGEHMFEMY